MDAMNPNDVMCCPYNKAHKMLRKKMQQHILKCREYYKDEVELLVCPFNKAHLILEPDYFQHIKSCTDRKIIAHYQHSASAEVTEKTKHEKIESEENWDDADVPDYDPQIYAANANVVREPNGMFPSQRRAFIKQERKRLLGEDSDESDTTKKRSKIVVPTKTTNTPYPASHSSATHKLPKRKY